MGFLTQFSDTRRGGSEPQQAAFLSGALVVNRAGQVVATTLPSAIPREVIDQIGRIALGAFAGARKINAPLTQLITQFEGLKIVSVELRGGALIFLNPRLYNRGQTSLALPAMSNPTLDDFILYLETYIECWKQFNHYVNLARQKNFTPEDEAQFLEIKSLIMQGLEVISAAVEKDGLNKFEISSLVESAQSLRHLADHDRSITLVESQWHKGFLSLQSLLGRFKVRHQKQEGEWSWGSLFGVK